MEKDSTSFGFSINALQNAHVLLENSGRGGKNFAREEREREREREGERERERESESKTWI